MGHHRAHTSDSRALGREQPTAARRQVQDHGGSCSTGSKGRGAGGGIWQQARRYTHAYVGMGGVAAGGLAADGAAAAVGKVGWSLAALRVQLHM